MTIEELEQVINDTDAVMVYFSGKSCGVCKVLQPKIQDAFTKNFPKIKQIYIDADDFKQTALEYNVFSVPTIIIFFDKKEQKRKTRNLSVDGFVDELKRSYRLFFD